MDEDIKKLLEQNLEYSKQIYRYTKYVKNYAFWAQVAGVIKILLIVVPIILGIIYLPPLLGNVFEQYKGVLGVGASNPIQDLLKGGAGNFDLNSLNADNLPAGVKEMMK